MQLELVTAHPIEQDYYPMEASNLPKPQVEKCEKLSPTAINKITAAIGDLRFGSVQITIHNGLIVQIDRTEKWRIPQKDQTSPSEP